MNEFEKLKINLRTDHFRNFGTESSSLLFKIFNIKYKFLLLLRLCGYFYNKRDGSFFYKVNYKVLYSVYNRYQLRLGIEIEPRTRIGKGLFLPHPNGIVINPEVIIGDNCSILHQVTIGNNSFKGLNALSKIGDNVQISAGAKIIGPCVIGNNVTIGANSVVTKNVGDDQVVGGVPAKFLNSKVSAVHNLYLGE
ncbi:serine acetyltransferase [Shewanella pneumatophori]|uniref:Serine acetyltransferase n=1 Tax=Shewanella pneumatophori TaxID=314092 RepID=A0A9X1ZDJ0_9GAMM|nr:serine acetyltransferase [Shewanella pneumatophori]MCL1139586.1 serine acetyltransferase [Shewanella pneumatophori]